MKFLSPKNKSIRKILGGIEDDDQSKKLIDIKNSVLPLNHKNSDPIFAG